MAQIQFDINVEEEDGMLWAHVTQLPGCFASGQDMPELEEALLEAIKMCLPDGIEMTDPKFSADPDEPPSARAPRRMLVSA